MEKNNKNVDKEKFWTTDFVDKAIEDFRKDFRKEDKKREQYEQQQKEKIIKNLELLVKELKNEEGAKKNVTR